MKAKLPLLTRAESELMQLLWNGGPATVAELQQRLERDVAYTTVLTLMRILEQKGYVTHAPHPEGGRAHVFRPAVEEQRSQKKHLKDLVDRLFGGKAESLVAGLLEDEAFSREELQALKAQIDAKLKPASKRDKA